MLKVKAQTKGDPALRNAMIELARMTKILKRDTDLAVGLPKNALPYPDGTSVVLVGFWNEFGTEYIPERAFLRTALAQNRRQWLALAALVYEKALKQNKDPRLLMRVVGEQMQLDVQKSIDSGAWEPNQGQYAEWKLSKGKTKPLINTGHMRGSIRYEIRNRS